MKKSIFYGILAFWLTILAEVLFRAFIHPGGNDLYTPLCGASNLLAGRDPYDCYWPYRGGAAAPYPMTTILLMLPFAPGALIGGIIAWSATVGLLVYAILERGKPWQLLILATPQFCINFFHLQFPVLIAAVFLLPELLPLALVKPQSALALFVRYIARWRKFILPCAAFVLLTFIVYPAWPLRWLETSRTYDGFIPALVFPACLVLLPALALWRDPDMRYLLVMAISPQRWIYDTLALYLLARRPVQLLGLSASSWIVYYLTRDSFFQTAAFDGRLAIWFIYLPGMVIVAWPHISSLWLRHAEPIKRNLLIGINGR